MNATEAAIQKAINVSDLMTARGFRPVFEYKIPSDHRGPTYYTFWVNLTTGEAAMTICKQDDHTIYKVVPEGDELDLPSRHLLHGQCQYMLDEIDAHPENVKTLLIQIEKRLKQ